MTKPGVQTLLARHHADMARASAAAMEQNYQEAIEICSELIVSGGYEELERLGDASSEASAANLAAAQRCRAEARLLMATAMHYADGHYEDIVRVLSFALESPAEIQKDVFFTLAVVHLSFGNSQEARLAMQRALELIELRSREFIERPAIAAPGSREPLRERRPEARERAELEIQAQEARDFLKQLGAALESN